MTTRLQWEDLTEDVRDIIWAQTGPVLKAEPISEGYNSEIAVIVHTEQARTFVKGLRTEHPRVWTQRLEQATNPHVAGIAARLRWQVETGGWSLLGFEVIDGRPVDYSPGSGGSGQTSRHPRTPRTDPLPRPAAQTRRTTVVRVQ